MSLGRLSIIEWSLQGQVLEAIEPTPQEVQAVAVGLAGYYNDPYNRRMMAHGGELSVDDVVSCYGDLRAQGARPFLLRCAGADGESRGALVGDADIRHMASGGTGEFAIMIGNRDLQGRGLGMRFAVMMHAFAFRRLGLRRVHVSVIPDNAPSRRLFEKLGYERDDRPEARAYADDQTDLTMSLDCDRFELLMAQELAEIQIRERPHSGPESRP